MKLAIFGFGGHAKEVAVQINHPVTFFVDDDYVQDGVLPISSFIPEIYKIIVAVSDPKERQEIINRLPKETKYFTFIHPSAILMSKDISIGEGSFIGANSILTTNIQIGKHAILNRGNQIGHDTTIGNFFSAMPGAVISGNVSIGDRVYLGTNSTIIEKKKILNDVIIGANGVVVNNLMEYGTYVGVPVKKIK
jgi:sugar O-acyltransferase (sialic acid O-acetyltransferase NeuD family)